MAFSLRFCFRLWRARVNRSDEMLVVADLIAQSLYDEKLRAPLAEGKEVREIDGVHYVLEHPIRADVALVKAYAADRSGNLVYRRTARNFGPIMAMAAKCAIAQVDEDNAAMVAAPADPAGQGHGLPDVLGAQRAGIDPEIARVEIVGEHSAGAVSLLDERWKRRRVGVVTGGTIVFGMLAGGAADQRVNVGARGT